MTDNIWIGRLIIVSILAAAGFLLGRFIASSKSKANDSAKDDDKRKSDYERAGLAGGAAIGIVWVLFVAGKDQATLESKKAKSLLQ